MKKNVGFIGWRGIVGSVLMQRMNEEKDFDHINSFFFSTSQYNQSVFIVGKGIVDIHNAYDLSKLSSLDILVSCQGDEYTKRMYHQLLSIGWKGYWIDTSSILRMKDNAIIAFDPINRRSIVQGLNSGIKIFVIGNCIANLMLMSLGGLFRQNLIEWVSVSTYQSASGGGIQQMISLLIQMKLISEKTKDFLKKSKRNSLEVLNVERLVTNVLQEQIILEKDDELILAGNIIPWIGKNIRFGQSLEEWKIQQEVNKVLNNRDRIIPIDGTCVRIGTFRCHSQSFTIKLKKDLSIKEIEQHIDIHNKWTHVIFNDRESSLKELTPISISGTLKILIGRLRKLSLGRKYISAFSIGDQLLWGAAEPLRRTLHFIVKHS